MSDGDRPVLRRTRFQTFKMHAKVSLSLQAAGHVLGPLHHPTQRRQVALPSQLKIRTMQSEWGVHNPSAAGPLRDCPQGGDRYSADSSLELHGNTRMHSIKGGMSSFKAGPAGRSARALQDPKFLPG
eukprot:2397466-Pyramimonas_sp.AAC.1